MKKKWKEKIPPELWKFIKKKSYLKEQKKYSSFQEGLAAMFACKAAIKAGDSLMKEEMQELVNRLFSTEHPYFCPHGRPIIIQMSLDELDGRFERH
mgnify:CR=1 FL=1